MRLDSFKPPTRWSRTKPEVLLSSTECCSSQVNENKKSSLATLHMVEVGGSYSLRSRFDPTQRNKLSDEALLRSFEVIRGRNPD
jgi:hypothetical protein